MSHKKHPHEDDKPEAPPICENVETPPHGEPPADPHAALQAEKDDLLARLQRVSAEFLNYKKRIQREIDESRQYASVELMKQLLPVLDDMDRALAAWRADPSNAQALGNGLELVHAKLLETLGRQGLAPIEDPVGRSFDPQVHSAICQQPKADCPEHTVLEAVRRGYRIGQRTIRPAEVVVSRKPDPPADGGRGA